MQGRKNYQEKLFTQFQLSQKVPEGNFYRRLREQLDLRWLYKKTKKYYGSEGQKSIDPVVFFKLILIGYLENLGSDRRIITTVSMRLDMLYFLGYDLDEELPWHSTLSRTRQLYSEEVFKILFRKVLSQCIDKGMVSGRRQAVDSVPVKANASMNSLARKEVLKDAEDYAASLKGDDEAISIHKDNTNDDQTVSASKNKSVEQHHKWKAKEYEGMPGGSDERSKFLSNHTHYSTTDRDARVSVKPGKARQLNYHAQVSVDTASHVITNIEAHRADKKDSQCLASVIKNTKDNLQQNGLIVEELLADAGFSSGEALKALEAHNITGYIPNFGQYKNTREGFTYYSDGDYYRCEKDALLLYKKTYTDKKGYEKKQYRSSALDCKQCPLKNKCIGSSNEKKIEDTVDKPFYDRMHERLQSAYAKQMKKIRSATVEPVLGTLTNFLSMRRVNTRGLKAANKCMLMAAVAYNLKKLLRFTAPKALADVKRLERKEEKSLQRLVLTIQHFIDSCSIKNYLLKFQPYSRS